MLKAGVAIKDISPKLGVELAGYPHCPRNNTGVHDAIYASVIYLSDGKSDVIFVGMDLLYFGKKFCKELRNKFGNNVMTFTTHTHCAPWASELLSSERHEGLEVNKEYKEFLLSQIENGIIEAKSNLFDAEFGSSVTKCGKEFGIGGNRRDLDGPVDDSLNVFAVRDKATKTVKGILLNYALHPTFLHEDVTEVSADYPGYIRRFLNFAFKDAVFAFSQGCSGNQSSRYFRVAQNYEEAARAGTTLGVEVKHAIDGMSFSDNVKIDIKRTEVSFPLKEFESEEIALKKRRDAEIEFEKVKNADFITKWNAELILFGAQSNYNFSVDKKAGFVSEETPNEVVIITVGDLTIVGIQGEIFVEFDLAIKELCSGKKTFVFAMMNGTAPGYLYTKEEAEIGGYEVGNSMFSKEAGDVLLDTVKKLLNE